MKGGDNGVPVFSRIKDVLIIHIGDIRHYAPRATELSGAKPDIFVLRQSHIESDYDKEYQMLASIRCSRPHRDA
jgi:hypothetical protein